jgi:penicillin-insensitive murein endopeptidase
MMAETPVQDSRKFFVLPQGYEGSGYYTYGTPGGGRSQYAHPKIISLISLIAFRWSACDDRKFGVGNISLANGVRHPDHATHRSGLEVDIRLLRKDGRQLPCLIRDAQYDRAATAKLVKLFLGVGYVRKVLFNDLSIAGVTPAKGHDNHFHVALSIKG